jgi:hypothetical protein
VRGEADDVLGCGAAAQMRSCQTRRLLTIE